MEENTIETEKIEKKNKKRLLIFNYSLWRILAYFVIYSVIGYIIETLYCIVKYGVFESRQSFIYGPFCSIYGFGAIVIIISLQKLSKKSHHIIFIGGAIVGSAIEYMVSWIGELILHVKWWDYSQYPLNLNGRICIAYAAFWGILSLYLLVSLNPKIDKLINWIKNKLSYSKLKIVVTSIVLIMITDMILTGYAIMYFMVRTIVNYDIDVKNKTEVIELYNKIYSNDEKAKRINKFFGDKKMLKTYPRLKVKDANGNVIYFSDLYTDIKPYYYKIW